MNFVQRYKVYFEGFYEVQEFFIVYVVFCVQGIICFDLECLEQLSYDVLLDLFGKMNFRVDMLVDIVCVMIVIYL